MTEITAPGANPLKKFFRQPKLYITLPSKGKWWAQGSIEIPENGEIEVYPMTAKDELTLKTPDALINGQSTVDIIQSCIPCIKNAWMMPNIDLDAILIAIRIATYGNSLDLEITPPNTDLERSFTLDLRQLLETMGEYEFSDDIVSDEYIIKVRPLTYKEYTEAALQTFEEERLFTLVNDENMEQDKKLKAFGITFNKRRDLTVGMITNSIVSITVGDEVVTNMLHITDFIENTDKSTFDLLTKHIEEEKEKFKTKPVTVTADEEQIAAGAPETYEVPIVFDQANFFA